MTEHVCAYGSLGCSIDVYRTLTCPAKLAERRRKRELQNLESSLHASGVARRAKTEGCVCGSQTYSSWRSRRVVSGEFAERSGKPDANVGASAPTPPGRDPRPAGESMPMWEPAPAGESLLFANKRDSRDGLGSRPVVENPGSAGCRERRGARSHIHLLGDASAIACFRRGPRRPSIAGRMPAARGTHPALRKAPGVWPVASLNWRMK